MFCDLHLHSAASDGTDPPASLGALALEAGLGAIALTDHDTVAGIAEAARGAAAAGVDFLTGIELSVEPNVAARGGRRTPLDLCPPPGSRLHLLGYGIDPDDAGLLAVTARLQRARAERNPQMVDRLRELGLRISYDDVLEAAGIEPGREGNDLTTVGRPHIAQVMLDRGYVKSIHEAFTKYLSEGGAAHIPKTRLHAAEAIQAIHAAGGVVSLAHPVQLGLDADRLDLAIKRLRELGLDALETRHSDHTPAEVTRFETLASRYSLLTSGGSDYHGSRKSVRLGECRVPMPVFEALRAAVAERGPNEG